MRYADKDFEIDGYNVYCRAIWYSVKSLVRIELT